MSDDTGAEATPEERRALFRVVRGEPTDADVAALTVVLAAVAAGSDGDNGAARSRPVWNDPANGLRSPLVIGPGRWRASHWPR